jgi:hypothetical protein
MLPYGETDDGIMRTNPTTLREIIAGYDAPGNPPEPGSRI